MVAALRERPSGKHNFSHVEETKNACRSRHQAGMVVDNLPAFWKLLPHQRKHPANISNFPLQMPVSQHHRRIRTQKTKLQLRKFQLSHRRAVRISRLVALPHAIKTPRNPAAPRKRQFWRTPIPFHKRVYIPAIPGRLLRVQNRRDRRAVRCSLFAPIGPMRAMLSRRQPPPRLPRSSNVPTKRSGIP